MSIFTNSSARSREEAAEYTRAILGLLGTRDPLTVLGDTSAALRRLLDGMPDRLTALPEAEGKWSIRQVCRHLADSEIVWGWRMRLVYAQDRPEITGYDQDAWASDPFKLTERDGRLHGLGICDMKGFLAMAVQVAGEFAKQELKQPLILLATADEERAMDGVKALAAAGKPRARYAVIGEPTGLRPVRMHKGIFMERIVVEGLQKLRNGAPVQPTAPETAAK